MCTRTTCSSAYLERRRSLPLLVSSTAAAGAGAYGEGTGEPLQLFGWYCLWLLQQLLALQLQRGAHQIPCLPSPPTAPTGHPPEPMRKIVLGMSMLRSTPWYQF